MILIAGCNGHVGRELLKKASARRLPVRCFDLAPSDLTGLDASAVEVATGDIHTKAEELLWADGRKID
jgi:nucleoside-diphosphate-sugar epimerase